MTTKQSQTDRLAAAATTMRRNLVALDSTAKAAGVEVYYSDVPADALKFGITLEDGVYVDYDGRTGFTTEFRDGSRVETDHDVSQMPRFADEVAFVEYVAADPLFAVREVSCNAKNAVAEFRNEEGLRQEERQALQEYNYAFESEVIANRERHFKQSGKTA